jgi:hypothetical protein
MEKKSTLADLLIRAEDISPYVKHKGKKVFKLHINRSSHRWMGAIARCWRRVVVLPVKNLRK